MTGVHSGAHIERLDVSVFDILCSDSGSAANWFARDLRLRRGMLASLSGSLATMGAGVPYAVGGLGTLAQAENMAELAAAKINSLLDAFNQSNGTDGVRLRLAKAHILNALDEMEGLRVRLRRPI